MFKNKFDSMFLIYINCYFKFKRCVNDIYRNNNSKSVLKTNNLMFYKNVDMEVIDDHIKVIS